MTTTRIATMALLLALTGTMVSACWEKEGPAERAGKQIDKTVDDVEDAVTGD
jgi:outer membrane lipoprotein-sorting protein